MDGSQLAIVDLITQNCKAKFDFANVQNLMQLNTPEAVAAYVQDTVSCRFVSEAKEKLVQITLEP